MGYHGYQEILTIDHLKYHLGYFWQNAPFSDHEVIFGVTSAKFYCWRCFLSIIDWLLFPLPTPTPYGNIFNDTFSSKLTLSLWHYWSPRNYHHVKMWAQILIHRITRYFQLYFFVANIIDQKGKGSMQKCWHMSEVLFASL